MSFDAKHGASTLSLKLNVKLASQKFTSNDERTLNDFSLGRSKKCQFRSSGSQ